MSYLPISDPDFLSDFLSRKEVHSLKIDPNRNFRESVNDQFAGKYLNVHSHQLLVRNFMNPNTINNRLHLMHACHAAGTKILMFSGAIKNVESVAIGDVLMGDDNTPRVVNMLHAGCEILYKVILDDGESFVCNKSHIITVRFTDIGTDNRLVDIPLREFMSLSRRLQKLAVMCAAKIEFPSIIVDMSPYLMGSWLGSRDRSINDSHDCDSLRKYGVAKVPHIPYDYKCNSVTSRLELLAGIIDACGRVDVIVECMVNEKLLAVDIVYVARSLGMRASIRVIYIEPTSIVLNYKIAIRGNYSVIPSRKYKLQQYAAPAQYHFSLKKLRKDVYYGFEINGNRRYLLHNFVITHNTGTGKTLAAVSIAQEFNKVYSSIYAIKAAGMTVNRKNYYELNQMTPNVFVLGFGGTKGAFTRELLRYPEFGFITHEEKLEFAKLKKMADNGIADDIKKVKEYYSMLKKRITQKSRNGFYKFFGYDEFVNRMFSADSIKLTDIESEVLQKRKNGSDITTEELFATYIAEGKIQMNDSFIAMFHNSLIIADEVHNTYNMNMKNNRGVAIQYLIDTIPTLRFLSLSATPINNSPTEAVELINYHISPMKVSKKEFFSTPRTLRPGKLEEIGRLSKGKISFLQDINPKYFPRRVFIGDDLVLPRDVEQFKAGTVLPYLKFIKCPMSTMHQATYNSYLEPQTKTDDQAALSEPQYRVLPTDGYALYDMVFPSQDSDSIGIFRTNDVKNSLLSAQPDWKDKNMINIKKFSAANYVITGDFLHRDNIGIYSTKYKTLLDEISTIMAQSGGKLENCQKIMIYHDRVKMSGVLMIQELLKQNGYLDETSEPTDLAICCICAEKLKDHMGRAAHDFRPTRFVMAHSDVDKLTMEESLAKFDDPNNAHGEKFMILVGSKIIKESYDFKDIQNLIIMSLPTNIPTMLQVFGRCIRKGSHVNLPPERRVVNIRILLSVVNTAIECWDPASPELCRYAEKLADYLTIQQIEREFNRNAIDATIHRDIIMPPSLRQQYFPNGSSAPHDIIGNLYFEPDEVKLKPIITSTFRAYNYHEEETRLILYIIKRLFMESPVWTYDDLWAAVRAPPIGVEFNPAMFDESNFIIALHNLMRNTRLVADEPTTEEILISHLFDPNDRYIYIAGSRHSVVQVDKYYIVFPVDKISRNPVNSVQKDNFAQNYIDKISVDVETYLRRAPSATGVRINIDPFVRASRADANYVILRDQFMKQGDVNSFIYAYGSKFQTTFVEEAISAIISGNTAATYIGVIKLLSDLGVILYLEEVSKYKDVVKQYSSGLPNVPQGAPIGYMRDKSVKLYDKDRWIETSKLSLNRQITYKENDIIVGFFESLQEHMKFKLRKPLQQIKSMVEKDTKLRKIARSEMTSQSNKDVLSDTRLIERGIVCSTKNKRELLRLVAMLGISRTDKTTADLRIKSLCDLIRDKLVEKEIKERQKGSKYKYLYSWWDEMVAVSSMI